MYYIPLEKCLEVLAANIDWDNAPSRYQVLIDTPLETNIVE